MRPALATNQDLPGYKRKEQYIQAKEQQRRALWEPNSSQKRQGKSGCTNRGKASEVWAGLCMRPALAMRQVMGVRS